MQPVNATIKEINGKIGIDIKDKAYFDNYLRKVGIGKECSVQIDKPVMAGTPEQNRFAHALWQAYFDTGMHSLPECFRQTMAGLKAWYKERYIQLNPRCPESFAKMNKVQRRGLIEMVISDIIQSQALQESKKLQEIIQGAEKNNYYGLG